MTSDESLYDRLGGQDAVDAVVEEFYDRVLADEDLQPYFSDVDTDALREHQKEFIEYVTGGDADYGGPSMYEAHAHLDVTDDAFERVADHLDASLRVCNVSEPDRDELLTKVGSLKDEIVTADAQ